VHEILRNLIFRNLIATSTVTFCVLVAFKPICYPSGRTVSFTVSGLRNGKVLDSTFHNH